MKTKGQKSKQISGKPGKWKIDFRKLKYQNTLYYRFSAFQSLLDTYKNNITALQQIRWKGSGTIEKSIYTVFYSCQKTACFWSWFRN